MTYKRLWKYLFELTNFCKPDIFIVLSHAPPPCTLTFINKESSVIPSTHNTTFRFHIGQFLSPPWFCRKIHINSLNFFWCITSTLVSQNVTLSYYILPNSFILSVLYTYFHYPHCSYCKYSLSCMTPLLDWNSWSQDLHLSPFYNFPS